MSGGVRLGPLWTVPEKTQGRQCALHCGGARPKSALNTNWICSERQPGRSDARGPIRFGLVDNQPVGGVGFMYEIIKRMPLKRLKFRFIDRPSGAHSFSHRQRHQEVRLTHGTAQLASAVGRGRPDWNHETDLLSPPHTTDICQTDGGHDNQQGQMAAEDLLPISPDQNP